MWYRTPLSLVLIIVVLGPSSSAQWTQTSGLHGGSIECLAVSGTNLFAGTANGVFLSTNNGTSWTEANSRLKDKLVQALVVFGPNLFAGSSDSIFLSTDMGETWNTLNNDFPKPSRIRALASSGRNILAGISGQQYPGSGYVFASSDNGASWMSTLDIKYFPLSALGASGACVFAGYAGGQGTGGVYISTDNGLRWTLRTLGDAIASAFAVISTNMFVGTYRGVFLSPDSGESWSAASDGLTDRYVEALAVSGTTLFAGSRDSGVFVSTNNGKNWASVNSGLNHKKVRTLAVVGDNLFAGTYADGVWKRPLSEMITSVHAPSNEIPHVFELSQNYPNPFNPTTTIECALPQASDVKLSVYDILGREVSVLLDEKRNAGVHEVTFEASTLASGVYLYRLTASGFTTTRVMLLLR